MSAEAVTVERVARALLTLARIVAVDERALPLYERLERELMALQERQSVLDRAKALANRASGDRATNRVTPQIPPR